MNRTKDHTIADPIMNFVRFLLNKAVSFVIYRPKLASACVRLLAHFPLINKKLIAFAGNEGLITSNHFPVPKQRRQHNRKSSHRNLLTDLEINLAASRTTEEHRAAVRTGQNGKNKDEKSPLEQWFH